MATAGLYVSGHLLGSAVRACRAACRSRLGPSTPISARRPRLSAGWPTVEPVTRPRSRTCSRAACSRAAVATLTYVYADQTVVLGPLATFAEPHTYDLCADHATRLTAPRGWDVVRLAVDLTEPEPTPDDLYALAEAVRAAGRPEPAPQAQADPLHVARLPQAPAVNDLPPVTGETRRRHLRALPEI